MFIDGQFFSQPYEVKVIDYDFDISYSWKWFEMGDGNYKASDRGLKNDHTLSTITIHGKEDYIENLLTQLDDNQNLGDGVLNLSGILTPVFGNNVDYDQPITAVLEDINLKKQKSLNGYELEFNLQLAEVSYLDYTLDLPPLNCVQHSVTGDREWSFKMNKSYSNIPNSGVIDIHTFEVERGRFEGTFQFNYEEVGQLLNFQRINRTLPFDLPNIVGVQYPFGERSGDVHLRAKLYEIKKIEYVSFDCFDVDIVFVQHFD